MGCLARAAASSRSAPALMLPAMKSSQDFRRRDVQDGVESTLANQLLHGPSAVARRVEDVDIDVVDLFEIRTRRVDAGSRYPNIVTPTRFPGVPRAPPSLVKTASMRPRCALAIPATAAAAFAKIARSSSFDPATSTTKYIVVMSGSPRRTSGPVSPLATVDTSNLGKPIGSASRITAAAMMPWIAEAWWSCAIADVAQLIM